MQAGRDLSPAMRAIGEHLLNTTQDRFDAERAPVTDILRDHLARSARSP